MINEILKNLTTVAAAAAFFVGFWLVNTAFGIWRNVGILRESFDAFKVKRSAVSAAVLAAGLGLFCVLIAAYPRFLTYCGILIPEEYIDCFSSVSILLLFVYPTLVYAKDAYGKLKDILSGGMEQE